MNKEAFPLLARINNPSDLKQVTPEKLPDVCTELRQFIIDIVSEHGGHLGASLGVIELTVALHYVFQFPDDQLIWDVGHQAYGHKILTERKDIFHQNRKLNGLSGFPNRAESPYDSFGTGHSSTSLSAISGLAMASFLQKNYTRQHVAVIGDGALTAGMAFEALNNLGTKPLNQTNTLIILNDNGMSIDPNIGALHDFFRAEKSSLKEKQKYNFFQNLNIPYYGIHDGHNLSNLIHKLKELQQISGVKVLHIYTKKGKGFDVAEEDQITWHAPGTFNKISGEINKPELYKKPSPPKYQDVFGQTLTELALQNSKIIGVTPAMLSGSSLRMMKQQFPERVFDVGIAEQHAVTFSAGLAAQGFLPFCNLYSTFSQRAYDQLIHDVCLQNLRVVFCLDRAGLVGEDGATHQGVFDLVFLRCIPNLTLFAPMNEIELRNMLFTAQLSETESKFKGALAIRYPRGKGVLLDWKASFQKIAIGKGRQISEGKKIAILSVGHIGNMVQDVLQNLHRENIQIAHFDMRFIKPLDEILLTKIFLNYSKIITIEDGAILGGFGSAVAEFAVDNHFSSKIIRLGIPDRFIEQGKIPELHQLCQIDETYLEKVIRKNW